MSIEVLVSRLSLLNLSGSPAAVRRLALAAVLAAPCACGPSGADTSSAASTSSGASGGHGGAGGSGGGASTGTGGSDCPQCVTIATLTPGSMPYGLFVDATNVYWTNFGTGEVLQAGVDGSNQVTLTTGEIAPVAVHVVDGFVYWASYSETAVLRKAPIGGGPVVDLLPAPAARELFVGNGFIWWTREPDDIQRAPIAGLPAGVEPDLLTGNPLPHGLTVDATNIYWCNRLEGGVKKADYDLANETLLAVGDIPWDVAVDDASIYWTEQGSGAGGGKVMKASKSDGSGVTMLAADSPGAQGIAVDAAHVYWANKTDGTIKRVPIAGGAATTIAPGQAAPINVAVDSQFVYWTNSNGDSIVRAPK